MMSFDAAARVIDEAIGARVFPAAVAEVGASRGVLWRDAFGRLTFDAEAAPTTIDTPFDLASLTKVMATTSVVVQLMNDGKLRLDEPVSAAFREWRGADRESVTVRDLLEHASGLPARLVDAPPIGRREFEHDICATRLESAPRSRAIYSDLGFILLGFLAEDRGGASLARQFDAVWASLVGADPRVRPGADTSVGPYTRRVFLSEDAVAAVPRSNPVQHHRIEADIVVAGARIDQQLTGHAAGAKSGVEELVGDHRHDEVALAVMHLVGRADAGNLRFGWR
jgi:CubicO group peptidase (beta-lactamase class C family)